MASSVAVVSLQVCSILMIGTRSPTGVANGFPSWLTSAIDKNATFMGRLLPFRRRSASLTFTVGFGGSRRMRTKDHEGACATRDRGFPLLTFAVLAHRPDLLFHWLEIERGR